MIKLFLKWSLLLMTTTVLAQTPSESVVLSIEPYQPTWYEVEATGQLQVYFYFFWTKTCPHCRRAKPFVETLATLYPWLKVHSYELTDDSEENINLYIDIATSIQQPANAVPAFIFCQQMQTGFSSEEDTGLFLKQQLEGCYQKYLQEHPSVSVNATTPLIEETETQSASHPPDSVPETQENLPAFHLPWLGEISPYQYSLPLYTIIIGGLDAFNPCAFFVLLFLLSLLVHSRKRSRMLLIGGIFIFFSGFIYFLFMAAWLNIFKHLGELEIITAIAGFFALVIAFINIKDFFWFKRGISLTIPEQVKPGLYQRMRGLVTSTKLEQLILSTIVLAIVVNAYELLCTAGFPMVYTRILTLHQLPDTTYYLYLLFYNIVYIIPLSVIVLVFTYTLGSRKLSENEGRGLKLVSGLMMLGLGSVLLFIPELLTNIVAAIGILAVALVLTVLIIVIEKYWRKVHRSEL